MFYDLVDSIKERRLLAEKGCNCNGICGVGSSKERMNIHLSSPNEWQRLGL